MFRKSKGKQSEDVAAQFLRQKGLKIINKNVQTRFGEIDIVALDRNTIVFVEVRSVYGSRFGDPAESISFRKKKRILTSAMMYLKLNPDYQNLPVRFDFVGIRWTEDKPEIKWVRSAFDGLD